MFRSPGFQYTFSFSVTVSSTWVCQCLLCLDISGMKCFLEEADSLSRLRADSFKIVGWLKTGRMVEVGKLQTQCWAGGFEK